MFHYIIYFLYHFSKSGSGWTSGIENVYIDPCQYWMDLINMKLTSPNYPDPYYQLENCTWTIIAPPGHFVSLEFEEINVSNAQWINSLISAMQRSRAALSVARDIKSKQKRWILLKLQRGCFAYLRFTV